MARSRSTSSSSSSSRRSRSHGRSRGKNTVTPPPPPQRPPLAAGSVGTVSDVGVPLIAGTIGKDGLTKGKGKGKSRPKTPAELNFSQSDGGRLWRRAARLRGGFRACGSSCRCRGEAYGGDDAALNACLGNKIEIGNLDEAKVAGKGLARLPQGAATLEVLCNRQSLLGNPFDMKKKEEHRGPVLAAYAAFLRAVLRPATPDAPLSRSALEAFAAQQGLLPGREFCGKDWRQLYEAAGGASAVRAAFAELQALTSTASVQVSGSWNLGGKGAHGGVRLLCHCAPLPCHTAVIAAWLKAGSESPDHLADLSTLDGLLNGSLPTPRPAVAFGQPMGGQQQLPRPFGQPMGGQQQLPRPWPVRLPSATAQPNVLHRQLRVLQVHQQFSQLPQNWRLYVEQTMVLRRQQCFFETQLQGGNTALMEERLFTCHEQCVQSALQQHLEQQRQLQLQQTAQAGAVAQQNWVLPYCAQTASLAPLAPQSAAFTAPPLAPMSCVPSPPQAPVETQQASQASMLQRAEQRQMELRQMLLQQLDFKQQPQQHTPLQLQSQLQPQTVQHQVLRHDQQQYSLPQLQSEQTLELQRRQYIQLLWQAGVGTSDS